jgi:tetratricopeptide (TPR) repeat protein/DNA-binding CsgD family transcriptional regulator
MRFLFFVLVYFFVFQLQSFAQFDFLLHKNYAQRITNLYQFYRDNHRANDTAFIKRRIDSLRQFAIKHHDKPLEVESYFAEAISYHYECYKQYNRAIEELNKAEKLAIDCDYKVSLPKIYRRMAEIFWEDFHNYELAFENYYKMIKSQERLTSVECPDFAQNFSAIGEAFFFFRDYDLCKQNMLFCLQTAHHEFADKSRNRARNAIGLCYQAVGKLDSAEFYFNQVITSSESFKLEDWIGIAKGNKGYNYMLQQKYGAAIPLLDESIKTAIKQNEPELAVTQLARMATCYLNLKQTTRVDSILYQAHHIADSINKPKRFNDLYPVLAQWNLLKGNTNLARIYFDSAFIMKDSLDEEFNAVQLLRVNQKIEQQNKLVIEQEESSRTWQRNFLLGLVTILVLGSIYFHFSQKKKFKQKHLIANLELKQKNDELNYASNQLSQITHSISDKGKLIEELQNQLGVQLNEEAITQLHQTTILTDSEWDYFRAIFDKVHKGFLIRLKQKLPDLTPAEIRFLTLTKLQLSNKEMASMLGVSPQSMRVTKHRMVKKLNLNAETGLDEFVKSI